MKVAFMGAKVIIQVTADLPFTDNSCVNRGYPSTGCGTLLDTVTEGFNAFDLYAIDYTGTKYHIATGRF